MFRFLDLPRELILLTFFHLPTAQDALHLAATCSFLRRLFRHRSNKLSILSTILGIQKEISFDLEAAEFHLVQPRQGEWYIRRETPSPFSLHASVSYPNLSHEASLESTMHGLHDFCWRTTPPRDLKSALPEFLSQFQPGELKRRRGDLEKYGPVLSAAAELQQEILSSNDSSIPDDLVSEHTAIALALDFFVLSQELFDIMTFAMVTPQCALGDEFFTVLSNDRCIAGEQRQTRIELRQIPTENIPSLSPSPSPSYRGSDIPSLPRTIQGLLRLLQRMLNDAPSQSDWSVILYVLLILQSSFLVEKFLGFTTTCLGQITAPFAIDVDNLCKQYFLISDGGQPLTNYLYIDKTGSIRSKNPPKQTMVQLEHLKRLHELRRPDHFFIPCGVVSMDGKRLELRQLPHISSIDTFFVKLRALFEFFRPEMMCYCIFMYRDKNTHDKMCARTT